MQRQWSAVRVLLVFFGLAAAAGSGAAEVDPPSRVARLGYLAGPVSFAPADDEQWGPAEYNRPLTTGDRLWADAGARAELQTGTAAVRLDAETGVAVLSLDDRITQLQLTQGTLNVRVLHLEAGETFEIGTPNLAFVLREPGAFRIEVDPEGQATTIAVREGRGDAYGDGVAYVIDSSAAYRFTGADLRGFERVDRRLRDDFDLWAEERDRSYANSVSARYVSREVVGYQDLDTHGAWSVVPEYGNVWFPAHVDADWAPYHDGYWDWVEPWGWTWVDAAPWGFAVTHYGRWTHLRGAWGWVPGPAWMSACYAPALVVFFGGDNFRLSISGGGFGGIGWFPLGPREVYRPRHRMSREYFEHVNRSNARIDRSVINRHYGRKRDGNTKYVNRHVRGAAIAVPTATFAESRPVSRDAVPLPRGTRVAAPVAELPRPARPRTRVDEPAAGRAHPPGRGFQRPVVVRTAPPETRGDGAGRRQAADRDAPSGSVGADDGRPARTSPVVRRVTVPQDAPPTAGPPVQPRRERPPDAPAAQPRPAAERQLPRSDERARRGAPASSVGAPAMQRPSPLTTERAGRGEASPPAAAPVTQRPSPVSSERAGRGPASSPAAAPASRPQAPKREVRTGPGRPEPKVESQDARARGTGQRRSVAQPQDTPRAPATAAPPASGPAPGVRLREEQPSMVPRAAARPAAPAPAPARSQAAPATEAGEPAAKGKRRAGDSGTGTGRERKSAKGAAERMR